MVFTPEVIWETMLLIFQAIPRTLGLALIILFFGILFGFLLAILKRKQFPVLTPIINIFISYMRGVPLIVHLLVLQALLPQAGVSLLSVFGVAYDPNHFPNLLIVIISYVLLELTIQTEYIRGALNSIDPNQVEVGYSIGFTKKQNYQRVILPQLVAVLTPIFLNSYLKTVKALSLAFTVGVVDILAQARYAAALNFRYLESYMAAALVYWVICGLLQFVFNKIEQKMQFN